MVKFFAFLRPYLYYPTKSGRQDKEHKEQGKFSPLATKTYLYIYGR
ncbi:hypothetical protein PSM36_2609 [Proteiniphilum saccharofermentans]|uniref:Uncharacterized protein n=1 Tax=Proteiniphilum saccharofermentans TaxID=1642647 RepID=A0A1R3T2R1_9BACT|nr:hypothetical protein PSM36_2609 [Proteiniphilum saccharofermentans]